MIGMNERANDWTGECSRQTLTRVASVWVSRLYVNGWMGWMRTDVCECVCQYGVCCAYVCITRLDDVLRLHVLHSSDQYMDPFRSQSVSSPGAISSDFVQFWTSTLVNSIHLIQYLIRLILDLKKGWFRTGKNLFPVYYMDRPMCIGPTNAITASVCISDDY
jgi:hypothetical protein